MRAGVVALLAAIALAFAPSVSAKGSAQGSAGIFPDLPGLKGAERLTHASRPPTDAAEAKATKHAVTTTGRVPAPDSTSISKRGASNNVGAKLIRDLPGGGVLPSLDAAPASSGRPSADGPAALALVVVVLFTRFLYRLNSVSRSAGGVRGVSTRM